MSEEVFFTFWCADLNSLLRTTLYRPCGSSPRNTNVEPAKVGSRNSWTLLVSASLVAISSVFATNGMFLTIRVPNPFDSKGSPSELSVFSTPPVGLCVELSCFVVSSSLTLASNVLILDCLSVTVV